MKKLRSNLLSIALLVGISMGAAAKAGPYEVCNVETRMELDLMCLTSGIPICCKFISFTWLRDTNEYFYQGQTYPGTYTPID